MKKFIVIKDEKIVYDTNNYLNAKRKLENEGGDIYEQL